MGWGSRSYLGVFVFAVAASAVAGCAPCREDTVRVELTIGEELAPRAARVHVTVNNAGEVVETDAALRGGSSRTIDLLLGRYREGTQASVDVAAFDAGGAALARANKSITLSPSCEVVSLALGVSGSTSDGGAVDGRVPVPIANAGSATNMVDILLVVDDSPGFDAMQTELRARLPELVQGLEALGTLGARADYHIGVITSDLGAGSFVDFNCKTGGLGGRLQRVGRAATVGCTGPNDGSSYIKYNQLANTTNIPTGQTLVQTLDCMASVGVSGCGFEQPLEAAYKALHDPISENIGFLRDGALLVVLFVTDEDDCSADAASDIFSAPEVQPPVGMGYRRSYRCTRYGVMFDGSLGPTLMPYASSNGPVTNPRPATATVGGKLIDVSKYIQFFTAPKSRGGVATDPSQVILASIAAPPSPVQSILANPNTTASSYTSCAGPISTSCQPVLDRSCASGSFHGDPAVRLDAVVQSVSPANRLSSSICGSSYSAAMTNLVKRISDGLSGSPCVPGLFADPSAPDCIVEDVVDGKATAIPQCTPAIDAQLCWRLTTKSPLECAGLCARDGDPAQRYGLEVLRRGATLPGTTTRASCTLNPVVTPPPVCGSPT